MDIYERLPVPFGLVRFGVAPDHPEVKVPFCRHVHNKQFYIGQAKKQAQLSILNDSKKSYNIICIEAEQLTITIVMNTITTVGLSIITMIKSYKGM